MYRNLYFGSKVHRCLVRNIPEYLITCCETPFLFS